MTGDFVVTGDFTNLQDIPVDIITLPQSNTCFGTGSPNSILLDTPLNNQESFGFGETNNDTAIIIKNAQPGETICFTMVGYNIVEGECCNVEVCIELPPCDCLQVDSREDEIFDEFCNADGTIDFKYTFELTSLFDQDVYHSILVPLGDEVLDPNFFDILAMNGNMPLQQGQSISITTEIFGAQPGEPVEFLIIIHNEDFSECCDRVHQVVAPIGCESDSNFLKGDVNGDGETNLLDVAPFVEAVQTGTFILEADVNCDGEVNLLDVGPFVDLLTG